MTLISQQADEVRHALAEQHIPATVRVRDERVEVRVDKSVTDAARFAALHIAAAHRGDWPLRVAYAE